MLALLLLCGCTTWKTVDAEGLAELVRRGSAPQTRVTRVDGSIVQLASPVVLPDVIADRNRAVEMSDIARLELKVFSPRRTAWLLGTPLAALGLLGLACAGGGCGP